MKKKCICLKISDGLYVDVDILINEEKGCVTAVARDCCKLGIYSCMSDKYFRSISWFLLQDGCKLGKDLLMKDEYSAVARCSPDDTFDVDFGEKLALFRLSLKLDHSISSRRNMLARELFLTANRLIED